MQKRLSAECVIAISYLFNGNYEQTDMSLLK